MMSSLTPTGCPAQIGSPQFDEDVVEVAFFLHHQQADALERAAGHRGLTTGQMLREIIRDYLRADQAGGR